MSEDPSEMHDVIVPMPVRDKEVVGATLRPKRLVTMGRRRSDRAVAWVFVFALLVMCAVAADNAARVYLIKQKLDETTICTFPR